jgi:hypothetical protein
MGNSTVTLQFVDDIAKGKGIAVPTAQPSGYGTDLAIKNGNDVMADIVAERFNWKWNRAIAAPFYTNSFQQDYPQIGLTNVGWLEIADRVDINNTSFPKPGTQITARKDLPRAFFATFPINQVCWKYNFELSFGTWPGAGQVFHPLVAAQTLQNPIMSMIDANGNRLIVTGFGTTGSVAPVLAANSPEGTTVTDGSVTWTVVAAMSQGFRVFPLPGAAGPVWQVTPYYQVLLQKLTALGSLINPLPDDYSRFFQTGYEIYCKRGSPNPTDRAEGEKEYPLWLKAMLDAAKQGDRELNAYGMIPASSPVEEIYGWQGLRNPQDPGQPY